MQDDDMKGMSISARMLHSRSKAIETQKREEAGLREQFSRNPYGQPQEQGGWMPPQMGGSVSSAMQGLQFGQLVDQAPLGAHGGPMSRDEFLAHMDENTQGAFSASGQDQGGQRWLDPNKLPGGIGDFIGGGQPNPVETLSFTDDSWQRPDMMFNSNIAPAGSMPGPQLPSGPGEGGGAVPPMRRPTGGPTGRDGRSILRDY